MVTLAGQTGTRKDGTIANDIMTQATDAYINIHNGLAAAGATLRDIVSNTLACCESLRATDKQPKRPR
jgi:enamine deaminase RidA (YjgF/YER057c/UK114 family)